MKRPLLNITAGLSLMSLYLITITSLKTVAISPILFTSPSLSRTVVVPDDFQTIQEAINNVGDGGVVEVRAGIYYESLVLNKSITLLGENSRTTIIDSNKTSDVITVLSDNCVISQFTIRNGGTNFPSNIGINLLNVNNCVVNNNMIIGNFVGIRLGDKQRGSNFNVIKYNNLSENRYGIFLTHSSWNEFFGNIISKNLWNGVELAWSENNKIYDNTISHNGAYGLEIPVSTPARNNKIYHNNFINNTWQASASNYANSWNDNCLSGGNYWSDYKVRYPHASELNGSGLWDHSYSIDENNKDFYPLMFPYGTRVCKLKIITTQGGTTIPHPGVHTYPLETIAQVTAIPNRGFSFAYWLSNGEKILENPTAIIMSDNCTLNAYFLDNLPPSISEPMQSPLGNDVQEFQEVTVRVNVTDYGTGVENVTLLYKINNEVNWNFLNMTTFLILSNSTIICETVIPGYKGQMRVSYVIVAYDKAGNKAIKDNEGYGYSYCIVPEFPSTLGVFLELSIFLLAIYFLKKLEKSLK